MRNLKKLIFDIENPSLTDFFCEAEEFINKLCHELYGKYPWAEDTSFSDIIKYDHCGWIAFKRSLQTHSHKLINLITLSDSNNKRLNNVIKMITDSYIWIMQFIDSRYPFPDFEEKWKEEDSHALEYRRIDIAVELKTVLSQILEKIRQIDPSLVRNVSHENESSDKIGTLSKTEKQRLDLIIKSLVKKNFISISEDNSRYRWIKPAGLYGFFIDSVSERFNLRPDSGRIPWKKFEPIFENHNEILMSAKDRVSKYNSEIQPKPEGYKKILDMITEIESNI